MIFSKCKTLLSALRCKRQNSPAAVERHRHFFLFIKKCVDTSKECAGETAKVQKSPKNSFSSKGVSFKLIQQTRRPDPDKYCDFDALYIFDYYSKGKGRIKKGLT